MERNDLLFTSNISTHIAVDNNESYKQIFDTIDAMVRLTNSSVFIIDFSINEIIYKSRKLEFINESTPKDEKRSNENPYWALMHENDYQIMLETRHAYLQLFACFSLEQKLNHTYIIDFRIWINNRPYFISQKLTPLKLTEQGELLLGLFNVTTCPNKKCEHIVVFGDSFRYVYDFNQKAFTHFEGNLGLTIIEKAILLRAAKGLTTETIAEELCKSVNTIKTQKQKLFKKLHVNNINEAITFVNNYGLL